MSDSSAARGVGLGRRQCLLAGLAAALPAGAQAQTVLRFGYFDRYAPLSERALDNQAVGLLVDRVGAAVRAAGLTAEHSAYPWPRVQAMVADGRLDGFCTLCTPDREQYAYFGREVLLEDGAVLVHRRGDVRASGVRRLEDLAGLRLGSYRGDGFARQYLGDALLKFDDGPDSLLRRIGLGDVDGYVEGALATQRRIERLGLAELLEMTPLRFIPTARFRLGLRHSLAQSAQLLALVDRGIAQLRRAGQLPLSL